MSKSSRLFFAALPSFCVIAACSAGSTESASTGSSADISDVDTITHRADGLFDVKCQDGRQLQGLTAAQVEDPSLCAPVNTNDPFDPASCAGAPIPASQILGMLDPARGVLSKKVGRFKLLRRERSCYAGLSCSGWRTGTRDVTAPFSTLSETFTTSGSEQRFHLNTEGDVIAAYASNAPQLTLSGDLFTASWGASFTQDYVSQAISASFDPTQASVTVTPDVAYTWMPSLGCPNGECQGNDHVPGTAPASWAGAAFTVKGTVTATCARFATSASEAVKDANGNDYTLESQLVILGDFSAAACHPTTCAEQNAACGSVSDGCGGTLACGSCASGQTCDTQGANHCRAMTPQEECAAAGRVFCPGSTGCWDACN